MYSKFFCNWTTEGLISGIFIVAMMAGFGLNLVPINPFLFFVCWGFMILVLLAIGAAALFSVLVSGKMPRRLIRVAISGMALLVVSWVYFPLGHFFWNYKLHDIQSYPTMVRSQLEGYRQAHGRYPAGLTDLPEVAPAPAELRYEVDGDGHAYRFSCGDPWRGFFAKYIYSSGTGQWEYQTAE